MDDPTEALLHEWQTPEQYVKALPKGEKLSPHTIRWHAGQRRTNGLEKLDAVRVHNNRIRVHRYRYTAWRLGELP